MRIVDLATQPAAVLEQAVALLVDGFLPDANGPGRPDIYMSKSIRR